MGGRRCGLDTMEEFGCSDFQCPPSASKKRTHGRGGEEMFWAGSCWEGAWNEDMCGAWHVQLFEAEVRGQQHLFVVSSGMLTHSGQLGACFW